VTNLPLNTADVEETPQTSRSTYRWYCWGMMAVLLVLTGYELGHYALWDDEANTALLAAGVFETGDTVGLRGENLVAYRSGGELDEQLRARFVSPLQYYLAAPFVGLIGHTSCAARLPFWLLGVSTWLLVARRLRLLRVSPLVMVLAALACLGSVTAFLYVRQARYYALTLFFSTWAFDCWFFEPRNLKQSLKLGLLCGLTFVSNYLNGVALVGALCIDGMHSEARRKGWDRGSQIAAWSCLLLISVPVFLVWNPLGKDVFDTANGVLDRAKLLFLNVRDLSGAEFFPTLLVPPALVLSFRRRDALLRSALLVLISYVVIMSMISPQPVRNSIFADVRYLVPLIPLGLAIAVRTLWLIFDKRPVLALAATLLCLNTSLITGWGSGDFRPRVLLAFYVRELLGGYADPYRAASRWLNTNAPAGSHVWAQPGHMIYPLMFHAPSMRYVWQLDPERERTASLVEANSLPLWHVKGKGELPQYVLTFRRDEETIRELRNTATSIGKRYEMIAVLPVFWRDMYRPELFWRRFSPLIVSDPSVRGIQIFELQ
jgi:4-amino-4-deoxy-L-arabinose transferase-like glycosyltransferase